MKIIRIQKNQNGSHDNVTGGSIFPPPGWAVVPDEMEIPETFPFVEIEVEGNVVTKMTAGVVPEPEPDTEPTPALKERVAALEAENKLLKEQVSAQADQAEFYEDCIAEMATVVYA